jgi:integrase
MPLKNGVDVKTISHILGHYSAGFTLDTYTHVTGDMKKEAAKRIGEVIAI